MSRRVSTMDELVMLDSGTVLRGPDWHAEVYVKFSDVEFYAPGNPTPYRASEVQVRGPYTVLWPLPDVVVAEEPEWEYGTLLDVVDGWERGDRYGDRQYVSGVSDRLGHDPSTVTGVRPLDRAVRRRKAGPWVPVKLEGPGDA